MQKIYKTYSINMDCNWYNKKLQVINFRYALTQYLPSVYAHITLLIFDNAKIVLLIFYVCAFNIRR